MNILIIEDEYSLADAIAEALKNEKFNVNIKTDGEEGEDEALTENYDLILLDVMLPKKNGFDILKTLSQEKIKTPIIMLTAKSEIDDKLNGLEHGADDYITKPFAMRELIARIKAVLKRTNNIENTDEKGNREVSRFEYKLFSEALTEIGVPYIRFTFQRFTDKVWCVRVLTNNNTKFTHTYNVPTKNWPLIKVAKMGVMNIKGHIAELAQMLTTYDFVIGDFLAGEYGSVANMINNNTEYAMDSNEEGY